MKTINTAIVALSVVAVAGCTSAEYDRDFFDHSSELSRTQAIFDTQAANGAAMEQTLRPVHFDGAALNSLGRSRLESILIGSHATPTSITLEGFEHENDSAFGLACRESVARYLASVGVDLPAAKITFGSPTLGHDATPRFQSADGRSLSLGAAK